MGTRIFVAMATLAGTLAAAPGGSAGPVAERGALNPPESQTFSFTGNLEGFVVPDGVRFVSYTGVGGRGGDSSNGELGGQAAQISGTLSVSPGQTYLVRVGGNGATGGSASSAPSTFNGGGAGGAIRFNNGSQIARRGGAGGGATDVRLEATPSPTTIFIAAGGGGAGVAGNVGGLPNGGAGGAGGDAGQDGSIGGSPTVSERGGSGKAATTSTPGAGGAGANPPNNQDGDPGQAGSLGQGGNGGDGPDNAPPGPGGGGGGGLFGGGGGGGGGSDTSGNDTFPGGGGGGGGGSSLVPVGATFSLAPQDSSPFVTFTWQRPETIIDKPFAKPIKTKKRFVERKIEFSSDYPAATFVCQLDDEPEAPCTSPQTFKLRKGKHTVLVRSIKPDGNEDITAAETKTRVIRKKRK